MENQIINNQHQIKLFKLIKDKLQSNLVFVNVIADLLSISQDAAYRRIRGIKPIDFEEAILLCNRFKISLDSIAIKNDDAFIRCQYNPLDLSDLNNYTQYIEDVATSIESVRNAQDGELIFTAVDIPIFNYSAYTELAIFKLFSWSNSIYDYKGSFDKFLTELDIKKLSNCYEKLVKNYQLCQSTEVWADFTIDRLVQLVYHHFEMGDFDNINSALLLCEQLLELINTIYHWTDNGQKGESAVQYKFYVTDVDISNTFVLFRKNGMLDCDLKLFSINHFDIYDQRFCQQTENWLQTAIQRSTLITGTSEKHRFKFFNRQRQKIGELVDKIIEKSK